MGRHWQDNGYSEVWPGTVFYAYVKDPQAWQRTGRYQYIIAGWEEKEQKYEGWEATGLHTRLFREEEVWRGVKKWKECDHDQLERESRVVAWWEAMDVDVTPLDSGLWWRGANAKRRDLVFPPRVTGFKPHGTLEMAGPMLFQIHSRSRRDPRFKRIVDVGAGTGRMASWLTNWNLEAIALDVVRPENPEFEVSEFDGRTLPLTDKSVDCALFSFVLHHCRHFEVQRALLMEAARVSRQWIAILEDTPREEIHWKNTKGHDRLGTFNSWETWMALFGKLGLKIFRSGAVWAGSKGKPSPYFCERAYFILEVGDKSICTGPTLRGVSGGTLPPRGYGEALKRPRCSGCVEASDDPEGAALLRDIKAEWIAEEVTLLTYAQLKLPDAFARSLEGQGFHSPSPIQRVAVPLALEGHDLVGVAATGSGKTLAYLLPMLLRLLSTASRGPFGLVLVPTRELALQVAACGNALLGKGGPENSSEPDDLMPPISVVSMWGGGPRQQQQKQLRYGDASGEGSWIVSATPGRLLDLICAEEDEGREPLALVRVLVLDEGDRMLEEGLGDQLDAIARRTAQMRQTLFFSATWREEKVGEDARRFCRHQPVVIQIGEDGDAVQGNVSACPRNIQQIVEVFDDEESEEKREERKLARLLELLRLALEEQGKTSENDVGVAHKKGVSFGKALVFCTTKKLADTVVQQLADRGCHALAVHGGKAQQERLYNLDRFASNEEQAPNVLVATDVLGRGIDLPNVTHVFVFDMPGCIDDYIHRIGRTARGMDGEGQAICFFEYADCLPNLAKELVEHLEVTEQPVPSELQRIAQEVAEGRRCGRRMKTEESETAICDLATAEELGVWNASGYRSWMFESSKASGWFVFRHGGLLDTDRGLGQWRRIEEDSEIMEVEFGSFVLRLQYSAKWQGKKRPNFSSIGSIPSEGSMEVSGWIQKSKQYKWVEPVEDTDQPIGGPDAPTVQTLRVEGQDSAE